MFKFYSKALLEKSYSGHVMCLSKCLGFVFIMSGIWLVSFPSSVRESWPFVLIPLPGESAFFLLGLSPCSVPVTSDTPLIQPYLTSPGLLQTPDASPILDPVTSLGGQSLNFSKSQFSHIKKNKKIIIVTSFNILLGHMKWGGKRQIRVTSNDNLLQEGGDGEIMRIYFITKVNFQAATNT